MTKRTFIIVGLIAALAGGSAVATAQSPQSGPRGQGTGPGPRRGPGPGGPLADLGLRGIELTDAQREQLKGIMESHRPEMQKAGEAVRDAHRSLAEATQAQPVNEDAIRAAATAVGTATGNDAVLRAKLRSEVFAILTAEQQEQAKTRTRRRQ
jgi:periplasmic protein CpxP/Spy